MVLFFPHLWQTIDLLFWVPFFKGRDIYVTTPGSAGQVRVGSRERMNKLRGVVGLAEYCVWVVRKIKCVCPRYEKSEASPPENNFCLWVLISEASSWAPYPLGSDVIWGRDWSGSSRETEPSAMFYYLSVWLSVHLSFLAFICSPILSIFFLYHLFSIDQSKIISVSVNNLFIYLSVYIINYHLSVIYHLFISPSIIDLFIYLSIICLSIYSVSTYLSTSYIHHIHIYDHIYHIFV